MRITSRVLRRPTGPPPPPVLHRLEQERVHFTVASFLSDFTANRGAGRTRKWEVFQPFGKSPALLGVALPGTTTTTADREVEEPLHIGRARASTVVGAPPLQRRVEHGDWSVSSCTVLPGLGTQQPLWCEFAGPRRPRVLPAVLQPLAHKDAVGILDGISLHAIDDPVDLVKPALSSRLTARACGRRSGHDHDRSRSQTATFSSETRGGCVSAMIDLRRRGSATD